MCWWKDLILDYKCKTLYAASTYVNFEITLFFEHPVSVVSRQEQLEQLDSVWRGAEVTVKVNQ